MKNRQINYGDHWRTPPDFYHEQNQIYGFDFDPCPWFHNLEDWDGLNVEWGDVNFVNPPYSQKLKVDFTIRGVNMSFKSKFSFFLIPVSTSTILFHRWVKPFASSIDFIEGRLPFIGINSKNQKVNYHLIEETTNDTIIWFSEKKQADIELPLHIKSTGQHDSMIIIFK